MNNFHLDERARRSAVHEHIGAYLKEIDTIIGDQPNAEPAVGIDHFALGPDRDVLHGRVDDRSIHVAFILEKKNIDMAVIVERRRNPPSTRRAGCDRDGYDGVPNDEGNERNESSR